MQFSLVSRFLLPWKIFLVFISFFVYSISSFSYENSNNKQLKYNHITTTEGLSQSYVFDIVQDKTGFQWFATGDGLNKYDGKTFTYYRSDLSSNDSLPHNEIRNLFIDSKENLWVGTQNGLSQYNQSLDNFNNFQLNKSVNNSQIDNIIWGIFENNENEIFVSTQESLYKLHNNNGQFYKINLRKKASNLKKIKSLFHDLKNNYWIGAYGKGVFISNNDFSFTVPINEKIQSATNIDINTLNEIKVIEDDYWLATDNGIYVIDDSYSLIRHYPLSNNGEKTNVRTINVDDKSNIWLGTSSGLHSINLLDKSIQPVDIVDFNTNKISIPKEIFTINIDLNNNLWLGTLDGIFQLPLQTSLIKHSTIIDNNIDSYINAFTSHNNTIWVSNGSSIAEIEKSQLTRIIELKLTSEIYNLFYFDNFIYIQTSDNNLHKFDITKDIIIEDNNWLDTPNNEKPYNLKFFKNRLWFINSEGQLTNYDLIEKKTVSVNNINNNKLTSFTIDADEHLWITNQKNQIFYSNLHDIQFRPFELNTSNTFIIKNTRTLSVSKKWILLGTSSQGLLLINKTSKETTIINEKNNLLNNFVADIVIDEKQNFWVSTNKGITSIETEPLRIKNYYSDYGINNEFLSHSSTQTKTNEIYFGGVTGFNYFSPSELIAERQNILTPVFTNLLVTNKKIKVSTNKLNELLTIPVNINELSNLTLKYFHSPFSFDFVSPNAKLPHQVGYKYRLEGLSNNWIETDEKNLRATYTNLSAGNYKFTLQTYDIYNPSITKSKSIDIKILPPWWLSNSAILIYTLAALLVLAYLLQQFRHKRLYHLQIKASEERLKLSLWGSGDEMWDWNIKRGKIYRSNIWGILDFPQDGKRNLGNQDDNETNINKNDIGRITDALQEHFDDKTEHFEATYRVKDKNNKWIWVLDRGKIVERDDKNRPTRMTGTLKDISQIKKADERLKLFAKCIENISDAVIIYDRKFTIVDVNKAYQRITGRSKRQMIGKTLSFNQYPETFTQDVKKHLITKGSWHGEIVSKRDNNQTYLTDLSIDIIRDDNKSISHFVGVFSDITKRKETEEELRKLANSDTLTGLPNRSFFQAHQTQLVDKKVPHALLIFDLDNFKKINDSMGHEVGDILLCKVAERLRHIGRKHDSIYRLGGDEFSLIVEDTNDIHTITSIAKNVLRTVAEPLKLKSQEVVLYSSIGIVLYPEDGISPHDLLKNADTAMYHAKHAGGNQYEFFNGSMNEQAVKRLQIEGLIRHGLKEDYFSVFYQPKIEITTGKIAGMEALVRFETPSKGIISPIVFIPVSEETGQIIEIGEVVLRKACYATKEWINAGLFDGRIAVNLSAVQFTQPNLVGMIENILKETQLPAKYLELEITEGTVMDSPQKAIETMLQIRAMGIHLSLDDFGTGYSSLAYLKKFPLNTLKIDKAFVDDIETSEQGRNMVATIVTIAHNLGLQVVAEGVETNQQLSFLSGLRCEQLQGYLYSKPLPQKDFKSYLLSHQITNKSTSFTKR